MSAAPNMAMLIALQKAVTTGDIAPLVPEALEESAHNILWRETSRNELTLLKLCPSISTHNIEHKYDRITSFGDSRGHPFFGEQSLPVETEPAFEQVSTFVRLMGEMSSTFLLASLEKTIKVDGVKGAPQIARKALQKNLLYRKNRSMYFSDTSVTRLGDDGLRFKGVLQQIREGTDGTDGSSPYGSHVVDMLGQPFTFENVRNRTAQVVTQFGYLNSLIMNPFVRADLEAGLDNAVRNMLPIGARPFMMGQYVGGMHTLGGECWFHTDNVLTPIYAQEMYRAAAMPLAPAAPAFSGTLNASPSGDNESKWLADDEGSFFWLCTELKNEREGLGTRWPTGSTEQAVTEGDEVEFEITPSDALSDSFKIYRGHDDQLNTQAYFIFEVANDNSGGSVTAYDLNQARPGTSCVFGLNIRSESSEFLHTPTNSGFRDSYATAVEESARFLSQEDNEANTLTMVKLGPDMGVMELPPILAQVSRPLLYCAGAMQCRNPLQNIVWINVGSTSMPAI